MPGKLKTLTPADVSNAVWHWPSGEHFLRASLVACGGRAYTVLCPLTGGGVSVISEQGKALRSKSYYSGIVVRDFRRLADGSYRAIPAENL